MIEGINWGEAGINFFSIVIKHHFNDLNLNMFFYSVVR